MLYNYRIKNRKDFYECDIKKIENAFEKCDDSIKCMGQTGGGEIINLEIEQLKKKKEQKKIKLEEYNKLLFV
jgi:hypothetical protein